MLTSGFSRTRHLTHDRRTLPWYGRFSVAETKVRGNVESGLAADRACVWTKCIWLAFLGYRAHLIEEECRLEGQRQRQVLIELFFPPDRINDSYSNPPLQEAEKVPIACPCAPQNKIYHTRALWHRKICFYMVSSFERNCISVAFCLYVQLGHVIIPWCDVS